MTNVGTPSRVLGPYMKYENILYRILDSDLTRTNKYTAFNISELNLRILVTRVHKQSLRDMWLSSKWYWYLLQICHELKTISGGQQVNKFAFFATAVLIIYFSLNVTLFVTYCFHCRYFPYKRFNSTLKSMNRNNHNIAPQVINCHWPVKATINWQLALVTIDENPCIILHRHHIISTELSCA